MEKMLFINYKEDQILEDKLDQLHLESRIREIELDHERLNVRNEWRKSRRKKIPVESVSAHSSPAHSPVLQRRKFSDGGEYRIAASGDAPKPSRPESSKTKDSSDNVNAYLLGEYRRNSEVIPSILLALSKKEEKGKKSGVSVGYSQIVKNTEISESPPLEPDLYRITKLARAVKTMRQNLAFSKKIDMNRPRMSLAKMFKDIHANRSETDQYTDGTCVLLKRKIEKRRRESMPNLEQPLASPNIISPNANRLSKVHSAPTLYNDQISKTAQKRHSIATTGMSSANTGMSSATATNILAQPKRHSVGAMPISRQTSLPARTLHPIEQEEEPEDDDTNLSDDATPTYTSSAVVKLLPKRRLLSSTLQPKPRSESVSALKKQNLGSMRSFSRSATNLSSSSDFVDEDELRARQRVALEWARYERLKEKVDRFLVMEQKQTTSRRKREEMVA